ncbi:hypothetical protein ACFTWF_15745 [Rhodococcus sp. NPDC056960]|uniref:hypothetical protein n=1 Tax=Rhodococcus sp. NPDC056960 TaxID=3345982 RepID=UPI00362CF0B6
MDADTPSPGTVVGRGRTEDSSRWSDQPAPAPGPDRADLVPTRTRRTRCSGSRRPQPLPRHSSSGERRRRRGRTRPAPPARPDADRRLVRREDVVEVVTRVFRHAGASAILEDSVLAKLVRDLNTISAHGVMSEAGFESHAEFILGLQTDDNRRMV